MVLDQYHHGVRVSEVNDSTRTIRTESMAIISIICAAPDAAPGTAAALTLNQSAAWPLIEGSGTYYGLYVIVSLNERKSDFFRDGATQQIEFDLKLERIDEDDSAQLASTAAMRALTTGLGWALATGNSGALA